MQSDALKIAIELSNQIEEQIPEKYKIEAFKLILQHSLGLGTSVGKGVTPTIKITSADISFSEFLNQIEEPNTNPQKFAAIAYFLESSRGESSITQDDIMDTMTEAGLITPKNFSRDVRTATSSKNALLMAADPKDGKTAWRLTRTGRSFIEQRIKKT